MHLQISGWACIIVQVTMLFLRFDVGTPSTTQDQHQINFDQYLETSTYQQNIICQSCHYGSKIVFLKDHWNENYSDLLQSET